MTGAVAAPTGSSHRGQWHNCTHTVITCQQYGKCVVTAPKACIDVVNLSAVLHCMAFMCRVVLLGLLCPVPLLSLLLTRVCCAVPGPVVLGLASCR